MRAKFPSLPSVMTWCTGAKTISSYLQLSISRDPTTGTINVGFRVSNHEVSVSTRFTDLGIQDEDAVEGEIPDRCDALVDLSKFTEILKVNLLTPTISVLYIYHRKSIRVHFMAQIGSSATSLTTFSRPHLGKQKMTQILIGTPTDSSAATRLTAQEANCHLWNGASQ
jgi:hypothetical protein